MNGVISSWTGGDEGRQGSPLTGYATVVTVAVLVSAVLFPETFVLISPRIGSNYLTPLTALLPLLALAAAGMILLQRGGLRLEAFDLLFLATVAYIVARGFGHEGDMMALKTTAYAVSLYYTVAALSARKSFVNILFLTVSLLLAVSAVYEVIEFLAGKNMLYAEYITETVRDPNSEFHRGGSTLAHPLALGAFTLQAAPFALAFWFRGKESHWRHFGLAVYVLGSFSLFFSFTRSSWIVAGALSVLGSAYWVARRSMGKAIVVLIPVIVVSAMSLMMFNVVASHYTSDDRSEAPVVRTILWKAALDAFQQAPLTGFGVGESPAMLREHGEMVRSYFERTGRELPVDNYYLTILVETGIAGFLLLGSVILATLWQGFRTVRSRTQQAAVAWAPVVGIVALLLNAFAFDALYVWSNMVFFWASMGLVRGLYSMTGAQDGPVRQAV